MAAGSDSRRLAHVSPVKGRMEPVTVPNSDLVVIVDYSHKPEALKEALRAVRGLCDRRLWVVFGAVAIGTHRNAPSWAPSLRATR